MAIDGLVKAGTESRWGISEEATFGTAIADNGTFIQLEGPIPTVDEGVISDVRTKANGRRVISDIDLFHTQTGGLRTISFSDLIVRKTDLAYLLYLVHGSTVAEGAATPYQKSFTWTSSTTQPDYSANAGLFVTLGINEPLAAKDRKFTSCILSELTLTPDLTGDGRLKASGTFISGFSSTAASTLSGTWAYATQAYIQCNNPSKKTIVSDVVLYDWSITYANNAVRVGSDATGDAETYFIGGGDTGLSVTGNILTKYDTATDDLIADSVAGTGRKFEFEVGTDGVDGFFDIYLDKCIFGAADKAYGDARGQAVNLPFTAVHLTGSAMSVAQIADAVDRTW